MPLDLQPGDVFAAGIRVLRVLGSGSFARVYEVEVPGFPEPLALKLTRKPVTASEQAQRALREITILRSLTNPHVVRPYDWGLRPDGHIYLLMDLLRGGTLDEEHDFSRPMPAVDAVTTIHRACLGLAEAHAMGIVHRDVKPGNIFVERSGRIRVLDFGLARSWDGSPVIGVNASEQHLVVGTPHYCQPEQLKTRVLTPASDVYSLATILFELLTARSPWFADERLTDVRERLHDEPIQWLSAHAHTPAKRLDEVPEGVDLPEPLVRGLSRCLDKDPDHRPPNAGALANMLGQLLHREMGVPIAATLRVLHPDATLIERQFLPGSYRIGSGERCEIKLRDDALLHVHAVLEWSGRPHQPHLRPLDRDGVVQVNDVAIHQSVELGRDDEFSVGATRMAIVYP